VRVEAASISNRLSIAQARPHALADEPRPDEDEGRAARREMVAMAVRNHLRDALEVVERRREWPWTRLVDWWRGTSIEQAYRSLHAARVFLVELLTKEQIGELVPSVQAGIATSLPPTDSRRLAIEKLGRGCDPDPDVLTARVQVGLDLLYESSDEAHQRIRVFRNILLSAAALIAVFMLGFVLIVSWNPTTIPLCFTPNATAAVAAQSPDSIGKIVCPHGEFNGRLRDFPAAQDIAIIAGLGLLGGALASAIAVRKLTGRATPYGVPTALALLKVPTGALTAVSGILLLGGGFVPGLSELDSQRQIVAYALVLGYAQQVVTRLIDDRANALLNAVPVKGPDSPPQTASVPGPPAGPPSEFLTDRSPTDTSPTERSRVDALS